MLKETIKSLDIKSNGIYVDLTFGGGGHSNEILKCLGKNGKLIAFDQDTDSMRNEIKDDRFILINQNFKFLTQNLIFYGHKYVDGILADLGVSSFQIDQIERGFSLRSDAKLDMRMNKKQEITAADVLNNYTEEELSSIFYEHSDIKNSRSIAKLIINNRIKSKINSSQKLNKILSPLVSRRYQNKILAKIYQAIRIEVNDEIGVLKELLVQIPGVLKKNGKVTIITYHSVEDRLVKRYFQNGCFDTEPVKDKFGNIEIPLKKCFKFKKPSKKEIKKNSRSRSAKLRCAIKL